MVRGRLVLLYHLFYLIILQCSKPNTIYVFTLGIKETKSFFPDKQGKINYYISRTRLFIIIFIFVATLKFVLFCFMLLKIQYDLWVEFTTWDGGKESYKLVVWHYHHHRQKNITFCFSNEPVNFYSKAKLIIKRTNQLSIWLQIKNTERVIAQIKRTI